MQNELSCHALSGMTDCVNMRNDYPKMYVGVQFSLFPMLAGVL